MSRAPDSSASLSCPLCHARVSVPAAEACLKLTCPDCGMVLLLPRSARAAAQPDRARQGADSPSARAAGQAPIGFPVPPQGDESEEYGVGDAVELPEYDPLRDYRQKQALPEGQPAADSTRPAVARRSRPARSGRLLFLRVFTFPFYPGVRVPWLGLSAGMVAVLYLAADIVALSAVADARAQFLGSIFSGIVFILALIWTSVACAYCLAILRDTAAGCDKIENWPDQVWLDWLGEFFYVINSLALSVLPGVGIALALDPGRRGRDLSILVSVLVAFPIVLLSMLETNSRLNPLSLPVWRSMWSAWWAWGLFYLEAAILAAAVMLTAAGGWYLWQALPFGGLLVIAAAAVVLVATLLIYFRLLGRLAWYCADRSPAAAEEGSSQTGSQA